MENNIVSGSWLKLIREESGIDFDTMVEELKITPDELSKWEAGEMVLSESDVRSYIQVLHNNCIPLPAKSFLIEGGQQLSGEISVNTSKNGAMGLLCASLLNKGRTVLHDIPRIEEVYRILEVFESIGVSFQWLEDNSNSIEIIPPEKFSIDQMNYTSASRTRTVIMLMGALIHRDQDFYLPIPSGCNLGTRTVTPHLKGLEQLGVDISSVKKEVGDKSELYFSVKADNLAPNIILMREKGDTATENLLIAAAGIPGKTIIRGASTNYMVMEVIQFLQGLGVQIENDSSGELVVHGKKEINKEDYEYYNSEDPIECMTLLTAGIVTNSQLTIRRCPRRYIEFEIAWLQDMGLECKISEEYLSKNDRTILIDIEIYPSQLQAVDLVIKPSTYPGINPDNAPFFVLICTQASGESQYHDWMFNGRNKMFVEDLNKLGASITMIGEHALRISGATQLTGSVTTSPNALRPTVILMLAMMAAKGSSTLVDTYQVYRGYQDLPKRLNALGAMIQERPKES